MSTATRYSIAQISPRFPPSLGGVQNVARTLAYALARRHEVEVLTTRCRPEQSPAVERHPDLVIRRFRGIEVAHTALSIGLIFGLLRLPKRFIRHVHIARAFVPELVWVTSRLRGARYVAHFHLDVDASSRLGSVLALYKKVVLARVLRGAAHIVTLSDEQTQFVHDRYGVPLDRISVLPNGVDEAFYLPPRPQVDDRPLRLVFVGRLSTQKNPARLVDAMAKVQSPVELVIVGDGHLADDLRNQIATLGLTNISMVGGKRGEELVARYEGADAFVICSDREGMPLVVLEAMAASLPVLSTDVMGSRETIGDDGLLVEPTPEALAEGIDRLAVDRQLREQLAAKSAARAQAFSWDALVARLEAVYEQVAS